jgi:hypothetical protein
LQKIYNLSNNNDVPSFIILYIILKCCNNIPLNKDFYTLNTSKRVILLIDAILDADLNDLDNHDKYCNWLLKNYNYLSIQNNDPKYHFIPLFNISMGMGYSFTIGWDILLSRMIGFIEGGSNGFDWEFNDRAIKKYFMLDKLNRMKYYTKYCSTWKKVNTRHGNKNRHRNKHKLENQIEKYLELITKSNLIEIWDLVNTGKYNILDN